MALRIAEHYRETIVIEESACMHRGDGKCVIVVTPTPAGAEAR
jgi:hypothetical protein